jgi:hypothetical protein
VGILDQRGEWGAIIPMANTVSTRSRDGNCGGTVALWMQRTFPEPLLLLLSIINWKSSTAFSP